MNTKPDPLGWCDCPTVTYYVGYMMAGYKVSHRVYHLVTTKFPDMLFDVKLYGAKAVFIDRLATRGRGNSAFRYTAENPPPTYPSWIERSPPTFDSLEYVTQDNKAAGRGTDRLEAEMDRLVVELARKRVLYYNAKMFIDAMVPLERFKKAKLSGGWEGQWEGHGKEHHPRRYGYTKTEGLKLCPARTFSWVECMAMTEDSTMCTYCGGKIA